MTDSKDFLRQTNTAPEDWCSCYYCISHFQAKEIDFFTTDEMPQAICPKCLVDSVMIGDYTNEYLIEIHKKYWPEDYL